MTRFRSAIPHRWFTPSLEDVETWAAVTGNLTLSISILRRSTFNVPARRRPGDVGGCTVFDSCRHPAAGIGLGDGGS
ncbi:MAG: hypothetical protein U1E33_08205 [Rhodospirillales bacterium]